MNTQNHNGYSKQDRRYPKTERLFPDIKITALDDDQLIAEVAHMKSKHREYDKLNPE